MTKKKHL